MLAITLLTKKLYITKDRDGKWDKNNDCGSIIENK